ncbi:V-set domain-containing T-cell activation inhibitor 1-like [Centropristis striata]|uniref:V-set domain-containing T-cell activation inhibitor 1-like n=1 Tax=Centropristis striata TaxID=184440 RepID=UPI0027E03BF4|nr:V-set domain-containing T-cell activation inhibitor 1-like [Centropristis striata]
MAAYEYLLLCSLLWTFSPAEGKELTITCLSSEECVLPCQFQSDGKGARIMWYKRKAVVSCTRYGDTSFVVGHNSPADKYKDRTGLFVDQVLEGNATLLLRNVTPHDQGKYFCITMTAPRTDESGIISLVLKAPVREVDVELVGDSVSCRAEGIFPAPTVSWSTDPPTDPRLLHNKTHTQKNQLGFYNVQSSLTLAGNNATNLTYICCVSCDSNSKTAFIKHEASVSVSLGDTVMVSCSLPHAAPRSFNLTWRLRGRDRSVPILSISRSQLKVWDQWQPHVYNNLSAWRHLHLYGLKPEHQGSYTCEVSTPEGTYVTWTDVTVTEDYSGYIYAIVIAGLIYLLILSYAALALAGFYIKQLRRAAREKEEGTSEALNVEVNAESVEEEDAED